jgi:DNA-binding MarR family transcriptional regulator
MNLKNNPKNEPARQAVETFWETIPHLWHCIRAHIRHLATEQFDISVEQFHILRHIRRGDATVSELAVVRNISRPAVSQAVEVLVARGLIKRSPDARDRRHVQLSLTEPGNALLDAIFEDARQWMVQALAPLSVEELRLLTRAMHSLNKIQKP